MWPADGGWQCGWVRNSFDYFVCFFTANCSKNCSSWDTITYRKPKWSVAVSYVMAIKKANQVYTVLWPFTTMKPSLMLGTSTGQELLFARIMSKSHTSAWKRNRWAHRFISTTTGLIQWRIYFILYPRIPAQQQECHVTLPISTQFGH